MKIKKLYHSYLKNLVSIILYLMLLILIILLGSWRVLSCIREIRYSPLFKILIIGERYYTTDEDIIQIIPVLFSKKMIYIFQDMKKIQEKIKTNIPWIKNVKVQKYWPNELIIYLIEYIPIARWNDRYMLDDDGKYFYLPEERLINNKIPMLYGPEKSEKSVLAAYHTFKKIFIDVDISIPIKSVQMTQRKSWKLILDDNIRIELGRFNIIQRLQRFIKNYPKLVQQAKIDNKHINHIDLRYELGFAVGWSPDFFN